MARPDSTRSRILEQARLFANEVGFDRLTTRELAARCAINEGNLYYYFKTKAQLIEAMFVQFDSEARALFDALPQAGRGVSRAELLRSVMEAVALLRDWCALSWHHRALLRDGNALFRLAPALQADATALSDVLGGHVTALIEHMKRMRALSISDEAIPGLVANIMIVSTHWLGYVIYQTGVSDPDDSYLEWGFGQILSLVAPYRTWLTRLAMRVYPQAFRLRA
ncbi:TetR/AcrR family transcriptional regulator [Asaia spathodeae]|uniref:TetR family transcriptional regulator n=1 Tax=Asaia spathodeae TaxID=657016 RepID=A0ABX2P1S9_9PROT|nr:TetR/AcrR family transcriptional regulator [Asaia spathodeae]